jgi:hypothetical protein
LAAGVGAAKATPELGAAFSQLGVKKSHRCLSEMATGTGLVVGAEKKKTPAITHGVFRRGENAPSAPIFQLAHLIISSLPVESTPESVDT